jgi:hypothetical protein
MLLPIHALAHPRRGRTSCPAFSYPGRGRHSNTQIISRFTAFAKNA